MVNCVQDLQCPALCKLSLEDALVLNIVNVKASPEDFMLGDFRGSKAESAADKRPEIMPKRSIKGLITAGAATKASNV